MYEDLVEDAGEAEAAAEELLLQDGATFAYVVVGEFEADGSGVVDLGSNLKSLAATRLSLRIFEKTYPRILGIEPMRINGNLTGRELKDIIIASSTHV